MKQALSHNFCALLFLAGCAFCDKKVILNPGTPDTVNNDRLDATRNKMKIKIGNSAFTAKLYDNAAAAAFKSLLPITVNMVELNGTRNMLIYQKVYLQTFPIPEPLKPAI